MSTVKEMPIKFPLAVELTNRIESLVYEYAERMGVAEAIGCLEIVKIKIAVENKSFEPAT